ncbi:MAG: hypothetical protein NVS3B10_10830 [Polyangiales bacterium]
MKLGARRRLPILVASTALAAATSGCPGSTPPTPPGPARWTTVLDKQLDRAVLSVWGTGSHDVFAVGGALGNGGETLAVHYDGTQWRELHPGGADTFWWVHGSGGNDVWMTGTGGRIAHWDGHAFADRPSGVTATVWGVFAFSPTEAWAVGGTPEGGTKAENDVVLRWDGARWTRETLAGAPIGLSLYKVWGTSSSDLWVVGEAATIWHRDATSWTSFDVKAIATGTLFTVVGCSSTEVWAVGGSSVLRWDGAIWSKVTVDLSSQVNGVACLGPGAAAVVGFGGLKQRLVDGTWHDEFDKEPFVDLHAVWADRSENAYWAAGGEFISGVNPGASRRGVVARFGVGDVSSTLVR